MRVAALYDIHGKPPGLEAVLEEVVRARVEQAVHGTALAEMNVVDFWALARYPDNIRWNATASPVGGRFAGETDTFRARLIKPAATWSCRAQLEVPLLAEPLERALQVSTIYFVATTESTQSDVLKPRAN
jgi:hypothetical protein